MTLLVLRRIPSCVLRARLPVSRRYLCHYNVYRQNSVAPVSGPLHHREVSRKNDVTIVVSTPWFLSNWDPQPCTLVTTKNCRLISTVNIVVTGASSHSTVRAGPSIAISTWFRGATSSCVVGDDNIISIPSHSTARAESSIAQSALEVHQRDDSNSNRVNPPDSPQSNPNSGLTVVDAEPEVKCSQDLVPDTQSSAESQVEPEQLAELTQVAAIKQADVKQSELEESQFQEQSGCAGASQHRSSRKSRSSDRAVELSVEEYADFKQFRKSRRLERR